MLCDSSQSVLSVVDIQPRLADAMPDAERVQVIHNSAVLMRAATLLSVPVLVTEQYPKGLGHTAPDLQAIMDDADITAVEKTCFACQASDTYLDRLELLNKRQVILCGMETHVCVLQTATGLFEENFEVFVVEDAVCSRSADNKANALRRLRDAGVVVTNTESVLFEWLRDARHEHFKALSVLIR